MTSSTDDELWSFAASRRNGILATIDPSDTPQLSNVYFLADPVEGAVRISTTSKRAKGRNLLTTPRAALHVPGDDFFNFVVISGDVECSQALEVGDAGTDDLFAHHSAFYEGLERPAFDLDMIEAGRMVVTISAIKIYGLLMGER
jgi:PPOX class probable F420-dependent enzyme